MFIYGKDNLTTKKALAIAQNNLQAGLDSTIIQRINESNAIVLDLAKQDAAVYGINTGFGPLCNTKISAENTSELQRNLLLSHSVGVGEPIDEELAKLMLILKVHSLAKGYSGISLEIVERLLWHIENEVIPVVPEQGSVGASGDLAPLSHLFLPLLGEGEVFYKGERLASNVVLKSLGKAPIELHPKAGLALINGTQFILAHAVQLVDKLYKCLSYADVTAALMVEGLLASEKPFYSELHQTRPHKGNVHVAARVKSFLKDSEIVQSHKNCSRVQDPYSLRCVPQVHGSSRSAWLHLKDAVEVELNSVTDNPIIYSKDLQISGGSFHGQPLALPVDYACLAAAEIGSISDRRMYYALEGKVEGTPMLLMENLGLNSGFMIVQYTSAALVSENKGLCFPSSADSIPTSLGQEDHVSMGSIGARKALKVTDNLLKVLGCELLCACQAFDFRGDLKSGKVLNEVHAYVRKHISHATVDRIFSTDMHKAIDLLKSDDILAIVAKHKESNYSDFDNLFETY